MSATTKPDDEVPAEPQNAPPKPLRAALDGTMPSGPQPVVYQTEPSPRVRPPVASTTEPLEAAREAIATLTDGESLERVHRSNLFDSWKEALLRAAETGLVRNPYQRQIVGSLLASTRQRDVVDYSVDQLKTFRTVTMIARSSPVAIDVNRAFRLLASSELLRPLALSPDGISEREEKELLATLAGLTGKNPP